MSHAIQVAAVQMEATPAPTATRLERAARLVQTAAQAGAQLVVLPEVFNTGYRYTDENYALAEPFEGVTVTWMKQQAAQQQIHLVGTLMLKEGDEIYNAALLIAPDGRWWRYDKHYPFAHERAYFRENATRSITIAETDLGKIGMMICWDNAHANLWERYAGQVQLIVAPSSPPCFQAAELRFPATEAVKLPTGSSHFADGYIQAQAARLGVPLIHSDGNGRFSSPMPLAALSLAGYAYFIPRLWGKLGQANQVALEADFGHFAQVIDADGQVVARVMEDGDQVTVGTVEIPDAPPTPKTTVPPNPVPNIIYFQVDQLSQWLMKWAYRRRKRA